MRIGENRSKAVETAVSQRALQMGTSFPCRICVVGFLFGVCLTTLFLAALTSGSFAFGGISFSSFSNGITSWNPSTSDMSNIDQEKVSFLYSAWSALLNESMKGEGDQLPQGADQVRNVPKAPHLENCKLSAHVNKKLDKRVENESFPPWTLWKGLLDTYPSSERRKSDEGAYPPWVVGSDEDNYPLTRKVQGDIWVHQHPVDCNDPDVKFLLADWETLARFGMGAQFNAMCGLLAMAINEKRVLVTNYYNRADHDGCKGSSRSSWSCYFFPETSQECRDRAFQLKDDKEAWDKGIITGNTKYTVNEVWFNGGPRQAPKHIHYFLHNFIDADYASNQTQARERTQQHMTRPLTLYCSQMKKKPTSDDCQCFISLRLMSCDRIWGDPWSYMQPTADIDGKLIASHRNMDTRWWRAQGLRYLMRFKTEYTCNLLNAERHAAFGREAAEMVVLATPAKKWLQEVTEEPQSDIERFVWSNHKPWIPRPLLSMHVRMGDKASEMKVVGFEGYMNLAERTRKRFPNVHNILVSSEMQEVIDKLRSYPRWKFYYTNVTRQEGNTSMADYSASLGPEVSTNYPLVNFLMAVDSDFFVGALGSTWSYLIDGMRNTGGKVMAGYLSVNSDRFW